MRVAILLFLIVVLAGGPFAGAGQSTAGSDQAAIVAFAEKAGVRAVNFEMGNAASLERGRADFTADGWKDFMKHMAGYLDEKGAPAFNSSFTASGDARVVDEKDGIVHVKIPGTLKQGNKISATTYKAAIEVYAGGKPVKIQKLEQVTCAGRSTACQ
jgi:predicted deacylase